MFSHWSIRYWTAAQFHCVWIPIDQIAVNMYKNHSKIINGLLFCQMHSALEARVKCTLASSAS